MTIRTLFAVLAAGLLALAPGARAAERSLTVQPYLQLDQTVFTDFKNGGGTLTYTSAAAGLTASAQTRRVEVQIDYRYDYRFGWNRRFGDNASHSGLARARVVAIPNLLNFEAGALATRTRGNIGASAGEVIVGNSANVSQVYSAFLGPTLSTRAGALDINATYRFGYTKVEAPGASILTGQPQFDSFDDAKSHFALASVGMRSGFLPFGWTISGGYQREDANQLDQRFEGKYVRGDVTVPVAPTVALVGGVGYEHITSGQRDALRDVNGLPVTDRAGRFVTDPASPRRLSYDESGLIWDTGVVWRPSRRTFAEIRVGRRYGGTSVTGSVSYQMSNNFAFNAALYDGIQTFGRQLSNGLAALPTEFTLARTPFGGTIGGCAFSTAGAGACLDPVLQSIATGTYRSRGLNAVLSYQQGPLNAGIGLGYAQRRFFAPVGALVSLNDFTDRTYYVQAFLARQIDDVSSVSANVYGNLYDAGVSGAPDVIGTGATGAYFRRFGRRVTGNVALGLFSNRIDGISSSLTGSALIGGRYDF